MNSILSLFILFHILCAFVSSKRLDQVSFSSPFEDTDNNGNRIINKLWDSYGSASVKSKFIRLTPDRQSKRGALWSKKALGVKEINIIFKFRISGTGEKFFGDGMALWITQEPRYREGPVHGYAEDFYGVGIIFDTFKNSENAASHRDVLVLINDKTQTLHGLTAEEDDIYGCNQMQMRFHEKRDDFSVLNATRVKVVLKENYLKVQVDQKDTDEWTDCAIVKDLGLSTSWINSAHVGMTASTGQLADNHDVIAFEAFSDQVLMEHVDANRKRERKFPNDLLIDEGEKPETNIILLNTNLRLLTERLDKMEHNQEHNDLKVADDLRNVLSKIEKKGDKLSEMDVELRRLFTKHLSNGLDLKVESMTHSMGSKIDARLLEAEMKYTSDVDDKTALLLKQHESAWFYPFLILIVLMCIFSIGLFIFYRKMFKSHLV